MLYEVLFVVFAILYFTLSIKIDFWITISILGFQSETPVLFIQKPIYYEICRSALFLSAVATLFIISEFPWYVGAGFLAFLWLSSGRRGRNKAFNAYRNIMKEMLEYAETEEEKSQYLKAMHKINQELMDEISNA